MLQSYKVFAVLKGEGVARIWQKTGSGWLWISGRCQSGRLGAIWCFLVKPALTAVYLLSSMNERRWMEMKIATLLTNFL
ncbi:MAG: hypothetical protein L6Q78_11070 [Bacteroidia bacterium]|nr:hypothetical protein [Bacteroidia bacterium]